MTTETIEAPKQLDVNVKPDVKYAIPNWLRDLQIQQSIARPNLGRLLPAYEPRTERIAIVGFGPSLNDTWEQIKDFPIVFTCSGAHKFLVERGIVPDYHAEVDPREHKVGLMGQPQAKTTYLISSTCHPKVFDHLGGFNVILWHVFDSTEEGQRVLPRGETMVTGGCDVGLRALTLAATLGFRDLHVFGMDGSARETRHAGEHPNSGKAKHYQDVEFGGVTYKTTSAMLAAAQQVQHELDVMPKVKATFYGDGLIQHMMRDHVPDERLSKHALADSITRVMPELISTEYVQLNADLHKQNLLYGVGGAKHADVVKALSKHFQTTSVLDYGCGKAMLARELDFPIWNYDPAVPEYAAIPRPADIVVCTDVLEHIEPDKLGYVLADLQRVTRKVGYLVIATGKSSKTLADGRNAHLIQKKAAWWRDILKKFFDVGKVKETHKGGLIRVVVVPKSPKQKEAA